MNYQRARLAGGPRDEAVSDQHDRRRDQPDAGALRGTRLDGGNMRLLASYLEQHGRPVSIYTDKTALFISTPQTKRGELIDQDRPKLPPTQIGRALKKLDIEWLAAHSPQANGRIERSFNTAQDPLVKGLRVAKTETG